MKKPTQHRAQRGTQPWHYTVGARLPLILSSGEIRCSTAHLPDGERPAVWTSLDPVWEPTVEKAWRSPDGKVLPIDKEQLRRLGGGLFRIGVPLDAVPVDWAAYVRDAGSPPEALRHLVTVAARKGADYLGWRVSFEPIARAQWTAIERWSGAAWEPLEAPSRGPAAPSGAPPTTPDAGA